MGEGKIWVLQLFIIMKLTFKRLMHLGVMSIDICHYDSMQVHLLFM